MPTPASLPALEANMHDLAAHTISSLNLNDISFKAMAIATNCMEDIKKVCVGYTSYTLQEPLTIATDTDIPINPTLLRHATDMVIGALSIHLLDSMGTDMGDMYCCLPPSSWFQLAMVVLTSIVVPCALHSCI